MAKQRYLASTALLLASLLLLAGCQTMSTSKPHSYIFQYQDYPPKVDDFQVCHDFHCENLTTVKLDGKAWSQLQKPFSKPATSASEEREQVKTAIALFEEIVGPITRTHKDMARNDSGAWSSSDRQLDCIAETVNTTTYLLLFEQQGWLKWHRAGNPKHRGFSSFQAPHNTAVIQEKASGREYAVDSWFHANGKQPEIVPAKLWSSGYDPDN